MYKLIAVISILIRMFYLPNPFVALGAGLVINMGEMQIVLSPEVLNLVAESFVHMVTFSVVGLYYNRGSAPAIGSVLYLVFYCIHIFILYLVSLAEFKMWAVVTIVVLYILCHKGFMRLWRG